MADLGWTGPGAVVADGAQAAKARRANADRDIEQARFGIAATDSSIGWAGAGPRATMKMRSRPFGREITILKIGHREEHLSMRSGTTHRGTGAEGHRGTGALRHSRTGGRIALE